MTVKIDFTDPNKWEITKSIRDRNGILYQINCSIIAQELDEVLQKLPNAFNLDSDEVHELELQVAELVIARINNSSPVYVKIEGPLCEKEIQFYTPLQILRVAMKLERGDYIQILGTNIVITFKEED